MCSHYLCTKMKAINSIPLCRFVNIGNLLHCDMKKGLCPLTLYKSGNKLIKVKHFQKDTCHLLWAAFSRSPLQPPVFVLLSLCDFPSFMPHHSHVCHPIISELHISGAADNLNSKSFSLFCSLLLCHLCVMSGMVGKQGFELPEAQHRIAATSLPSW